MSKFLTPKQLPKLNILNTPNLKLSDMLTPLSNATQSTQSSE